MAGFLASDDYIVDLRNPGVSDPQKEHAPSLEHPTRRARQELLLCGENGRRM
jgi:hypothetical protein